LKRNPGAQVTLCWQTQPHVSVAHVWYCVHCWLQVPSHFQVQLTASQTCRGVGWGAPQSSGHSH